MSKLAVSIVGGSGFVGGELLRLLLGHPQVEVRQVSSRRLAGQVVTRLHPNLRRLTDLRFCAPDDIERCDLLLLCARHGEALTLIDDCLRRSDRVIDLSADFRLRDPAAYLRWYGREHGRPDLLARFVYGIPELHRAELKTASLVACAGCNATAAVLALWPLFRGGLVAGRQVVIDAKVGSSEAGAEATPGSHHPIRANCVRSYRPTGHRHVAEIVQALSNGAPLTVHMSATAIDIVRGVVVTCQVQVADAVDERDVWGAYRQAYRDEPFVRLFKQRDGLYRYPEPKLLAGTNFCDIGFERDRHAGRLVVIAALDNLMKGAAGQAVQCMNVMCGFDERTSLEFPGLHP